MAIDYERARSVDAVLIRQLYTDVGAGVVSLDLVEDAIEGLPAFVARDYGALVGFTYCQPFAPDIAELANIFVHPEFRRAGIGSELLNRTERSLTDTGIYAAVLATNSELYQKNPTDSTERFYAKNGYRTILTTGPTRILTKHLSFPAE